MAHSFVVRGKGRLDLGKDRVRTEDDPKPEIAGLDDYGFVAVDSLEKTRSMLCLWGAGGIEKML